MARQRYDLQPAHYDERGGGQPSRRRPNYTMGDRTCADERGRHRWARTPWHATQRTAQEALRQADANYT
jgi:hypothetical protein